MPCSLVVVIIATSMMLSCAATSFTVCTCHVFISRSQRCCVCFLVLLCGQAITGRSRYGNNAAMQQVRQKKHSNSYRRKPIQISTAVCSHCVIHSGKSSLPGSQGGWCSCLRYISTYLHRAAAVALHHVYHCTSSVLYSLRLPWPFSAQALRFLPWSNLCGCSSCSTPTWPPRSVVARLQQLQSRRQW